MVLRKNVLITIGWIAMIFGADVPVSVKGAVRSSIPIHFYQIQRICPHGPLAVLSVCAKKISDVHTQACLCNCETNNVS